MTENTTAASPFPPAVLVQRFNAKVANGAMYLTLFGVGVAESNGPLREVSAFTGFFSREDAVSLAAMLAQAATALQTLAADETKPQ